ncbi:MAG: PAS domain-containing protein [Terracidiphilus sp.]
MQGRAFGRRSFPSVPLRVSASVTVLGAAGLLAIVQWTTLSVREHTRIASTFVFPAALESERAGTAFVRMNRAYSDAVLLQEKADLDDADHEAATVITSLASAAKLMEFNRGRQGQIAALQQRIAALHARSRVSYASIAENSAHLPSRREMADLTQENQAVQEALESLQGNLASDLRSELSLINRLLVIQEFYGLAVFAGIVVALILGVRSWMRSKAEKQQDEMARQASAVLENERHLLRSLIDNIPDFVYVKDAESRFLTANAFLVRAVGAQSPDEVLGKTDFDFFPEELARGYFEDDQNVIRTGTPLFGREERVIDREGKECIVSTTKVPLRDSSGRVTGLVGIGHDITERVRMMSAVRETELKYHSIFDSATVGIFQSTPEGRFINVNPSMAATQGYGSPKEMLAESSGLGERFFVDAGHGAEFMMTMDRRGGVRDFECEVYRRDGSTIWLTMNIRAIRENGAVVRYEGMCEDVTERKLLRAQLLQAQKLESVGQLAAGIAHEINTPAQYVGDNVRFLKDVFPNLLETLEVYGRLLTTAKGGAWSQEAVAAAEATAERVDLRFLTEEIPKAIDQTLEGIGRVTALVAAMKEFSHPGTTEKAVLDLNHAIESTITISRNEWKFAADVETKFDRSLSPVCCYPGEFNQVILNLIVNAAHAIEDANRQRGLDKGKITVETRNEPEYAEIRVQDTGTGIPEDVQARIFDPFFTTKDIGKGTGQGLAIARSVIVDKHGGTIHFETKVGEGTTFIVRLPHGDKTPKEAEAQA